MSRAEEQAVAPRSPSAGRFEGLPDVGLRSRTARGTMVNAAFLVGTNALTLVRGLVLATFLTTAQYGLWGLLMAAFTTLLMLGSVGIDDKYIQQDDADQQRAFEIAFTLQCCLAALFVVVIGVGMPLFSLLYGNSDLILPGIAFATAMPAIALQTPLWVHYRRMDFVRQRTLQVIDPVVTTVATLALAAAGLGVWALVIGALTGTWVAAIAIARSSPYKLRLRWDRATVRDYTHFSGPLFVGALSNTLWVQAPVAVASRLLGVNAVGGIALANNISMFTTRVDDVVTQSLYPAICAVKDRADLLFESFWKSNRLALLWAAPLGAAAALFARDFTNLIVGDKWHFATPLIAVYGINAVLNQIGFNWTAFFRAIGDTRPIATENLIALASMLAVSVPLMVLEGLTGFAVGVGIGTMISVVIRLSYLRRIFPTFAMVGHIAGGIGPTVPAAFAVLLLRWVEPSSRTPGRVVTEAVTFAAVAVVVTFFSQRNLLRESVGYLRGARLAGASG